ncbi:hypothetical protein D9M69_520010 [compost metagenome]
MLQATQHAQIQLQATLAEHEKTRPRGYAEALQHMGESIGPLAQLAETDVMAIAIAVQQPQRHPLPGWSLGMPVDRFEGQVQPAARQPGQRLGLRPPGKRGPSLGSVRPVGADGQVTGYFLDGGGAHGPVLPLSTIFG